jgi:hypothetical protein
MRKAGQDIPSSFRDENVALYRLLEAQGFVSDHWPFIVAVAKLLIERGTVYGADIEALLERESNRAVEPNG